LEPELQPSSVGAFLMTEAEKRRVINVTRAKIYFEEIDEQTLSLHEWIRVFAKILGFLLMRYIEENEK
jgi:hypothetical protein